MRCILLILCLSWAAPGWAARIIALESQPGRVIVTADGPLPAAKAFALSDPFRLVVDFVGVVGSGLLAPGTNSVASLRAAMFAPGTARLVIDLRTPVIIREARAQGNQVILFLERVPPDLFAAHVARGRRPLPLLRSEESPPPPTLATGSFSLPPDFGRPRPDAAQPLGRPAELPPEAVPDKPAAAPPKPPAEPPAQSPSPAPVLRIGIKSRTGDKPLVVIDAGHGGKDVGAISVMGGYEKNITLSIARETARILRSSGRVRVKLTRDEDRFIPLGGRVRIARDARADLFISIHADSAPNDQARGASVYTLSAVASDAIAERLASRENKADIIGGINLGVEAPEVGEIMVDLARRATGNVSVQFADMMQDALEEQEIGFRGEFHHFAAFAVLKAPDVPSVLLETGYVTNKDDAQRLISEDGRRRMARGIARAIEKHLTGK